MHTYGTIIVFLLFGGRFYTGVMLKSVPILVGGSGLKCGDVNLYLAHEIVFGERVLVPDHHADDAMHCEWTLKSHLKIFLPPRKSSFVYYLYEIQ